jgi:hypothetical protein
MIERLNGRAGFDPEAFLNSHRVAKRITSFEKAETIYSQGLLMLGSIPCSLSFCRYSRLAYCTP